MFDGSQGKSFLLRFPLLLRHSTSNTTSVVNQMPNATLATSFKIQLSTRNRVNVNWRIMSGVLLHFVFCLMPKYFAASVISITFCRNLRVSLWALSQSQRAYAVIQLQTILVVADGGR